MEKSKPIEVNLHGSLFHEGQYVHEIDSRPQALVNGEPVQALAGNMQTLTHYVKDYCLYQLPPGSEIIGLMFLLHPNADVTEECFYNNTPQKIHILTFDEKYVCSVLPGKRVTFRKHGKTWKRHMKSKE